MRPEPIEAREIQEQIAALERLRRRRHRLANWIFLLAGLWFGSAAYLARTRFAEIWRGGRFFQWAAIVAVGCAIFFAGSRRNSHAVEVDDRLRDLKDQLLALRTPKRT